MVPRSGFLGVIMFQIHRSEESVSFPLAQVEIRYFLDILKVIDTDFL